MYVAPRLAAELEFVHCLIYYKNDVQRTIAFLSLNCYRKLPTPYVARRSLVSPFNRPQPMHQEATQCWIHVRERIFKLQVLIDNYLPLCLMACPITLNLALKLMRNHLLKTMWYNLNRTNSYEKITHMHSTLAVRL